MAHGYLKEYISKKKKDINGTDYANLVHVINNAHKMGFSNVYHPRLIERVIQIFLKDHSELYYFSTADQLKLLKAFDSLLANLET